MKKPSITTLIGLLDKPALLHWANKIGLEGITLSEYRKESAGKGTSLHKQVNDFILKDVPFEDPQHQQNFIDFLEREGVEEIFALEKKIEHDWFNGRYDIFLQAKGIKYLCDFKSNDKVYFDQVMQLTAYRMAEPCDKIAVIQVPEFIFKPIEVKMFNLYECIISDLYSIYRNKEHLKEAGELV